MPDCIYSRKHSLLPLISIEQNRTNILIHNIINNNNNNNNFKLTRAKIFFQFYSHANSTHGNVVRVAPRPKISTATSTPTYSYNLANSFPSTTFSANFHPNSSFTNFTTANSNNYPNYSNGPTAASAAGIGVTGAAANMHHQQSSPMVAANMKLSASASMRSTNSTMACNPFLAKCSNTNPLNCDQKPGPMDKKFNSLKSTGVKKTPQFYSMRLNKCKRHQSFSKEPQKLLLINGTNGSTMPYMPDGHPAQSSSHHMQKRHHKQQHGTIAQLKNCTQPLYENLTDSIQIHESFAPNESSFASVLDDFNFETERNSIYRSDSGISNSSYECITPVPAPRTNPRKCRSAPVYMNLPNQYGSGRFSTGGSGKYSSKGKGGCRFMKPNKCKNNTNANATNLSQNTQIADASALFNYEVCLT